MLLGLSLFWVGAVLFLNGLWVLGKVGDREISVIDVFVGTVTLAVATYLAFGPALTRPASRARRFCCCLHLPITGWLGTDGMVPMGAGLDGFACLSPSPAPR